jgi:hypothetical protein
LRERRRKRVGGRVKRVGRANWAGDLLHFCGKKKREGRCGWAER